MMNFELEQKLQYVFRDKALLGLALTHCSYSTEHGGKNSQRLEFLGDAVIETCISTVLFRKFTDRDEGGLTRLRASVVSEAPLARAAERLELGQFIRLGQGERAGGGEHKPSVLSDTLEAVFAAVYLDGGFDSACSVICHVLANEIESANEAPLDAKSTLQEKLFRNGNVQVEYRLVSRSGPPHDSHFISEVYCNGRLLGRGEGASKKKAEQSAAKAALNTIR